MNLKSMLRKGLLSGNMFFCQFSIFLVVKICNYAMNEKDLKDLNPIPCNQTYEYYHAFDDPDGNQAN